MENEKGKKQQKPGRMEYDVNDTSRTMKPGSMKGSTTTSQNSTSSPPTAGGSGGITNSGSSHQGRGWHGDPEGHAKAGSQSHKKSGGSKKK